MHLSTILVKYFSTQQRDHEDADYQEGQLQATGKQNNPDGVSSELREYECQASTQQECPEHSVSPFDGQLSDGRYDAAEQ